MERKRVSECLSLNVYMCCSGVCIWRLWYKIQKARTYQNIHRDFTWERERNNDKTHGKSKDKSWNGINDEDKTKKEKKTGNLKHKNTTGGQKKQGTQGNDCGQWDYLNYNFKMLKH